MEYKKEFKKEFFICYSIRHISCLIICLLHNNIHSEFHFQKLRYGVSLVFKFSSDKGTGISLNHMHQENVSSIDINLSLFCS